MNYIASTPGSLKKESISIVIPVYNAELTLQELYQRLSQLLEEISDKFEIILIEDCGRDRSWEVIKELSSQDARVRGFKLSRNFGQHNALLCGIRAARYDVIVTLDDDLQHPVSEIPVLLNKLTEGYDVVYGTPQQEQHGFWRDIASRLTKLALQSAMGVETGRNVSAFRAFHTRLRDGFMNYRSPTVSIDVLLTWATTSFASVKVEHAPRMTGVSNYTFGKLINHALNLLTGFSTLPLHIASFMGFLFTLFGIAVLTWVVGRYFIIGSAVPGFAFLASMIAIFSGVQLFSLGIIGEYLARMHFRTMEQPTYLVKESSDVSDDEHN